MTKLTSIYFCRTALSALLLSGAAVAAAQASPAPALLPTTGTASLATAPSASDVALPNLTVADAALPGVGATAAIAPGSPETAIPPAIADPASVADEPLPASPVSSSLPDAPSELRASLPDAFVLDPPGQATPNVAPRLTKYIPSGWTAQTITGRDKFLLGVRDLYSPLNFVAMIASAGYEHVLNGEPNYGTDRGAFGQRLGAAAIRESTQGFLTDSVFSPIFHEDPRYYIQGYGHSFLYRTAYAATRPFITRTDNGNSTINAALLVGYAGSSALSYAYYPQINRNFHDTAATFGSSLGGAALGYFVSEFSDDALKAFHLRKKQ